MPPEPEGDKCFANLEYKLLEPNKNLNEKEWLEQRKLQLNKFEYFNENQRKQYLFEAVWAVGFGDVSAARALDLIMEIKLSTPERQKKFLDALWVTGVAVDMSSNSPTRMHDLDAFIHHICVKGKNSSDEFPIRPVDIASALEAQLVPPALNLEFTNLKKRKNQARTKAKLTVPHYNLLREHVEGYTYITLLLNRFLHVNENEVAVTQLVDAITQAIGFFSLCVARVLSLVLDVLEQKLTCETTTSFDSIRRLLHWFPSNRIIEVVSFQLKRHDRMRHKSDGEYRALAWLAVEEFIDGDAIWRQFPNVHDTLYDQLVTTYEKTVQDPRTNWDDLAQEFYQLDSPHLRFIAAFLSIHCHTMAHRYWSFLHVRPELNYYVQVELLSLVWHFVEPLLVESECMLPGVITPPKRSHTASICLSKDEPLHAQAKTWDDLSGPEMRKLLEFCDSTLANDQNLLCTLWRLMRVTIENAPDDDKVDFIIFRYLLPACSMSEPSPCLCDLVWSVMRLIPVSRRYRIYGHWDNMYEEMYPLKLVQARTRREVKQLLKRVVSKADRQDTFSSQVHYHFAKLCQPNPLVACEVMTKDIEVGFNNNLIVPYIDCTVRIPEICQDVFAFVLTRSAFKPRNLELLNESAAVSTWFENIAEFTAIFFKRHANADIFGFLKILVSKIEESAQNSNKLSDSLVRIVLLRLFEHMGGMIVIQDMTEDQTFALAGGPILWRHAAHGDNEEHFEELQKARQRLLKAFQHDMGLVQVLMQALSQQGSNLINEPKLTDMITDAGGLKLLGVLFDGANGILLKTVLFLKNASTKEQYRAFLPAFSRVFEMFDPAMAFRVIRPALLPSDPFPYYPAGMEKAGVSKEFYRTFWSMSLRDIHHPTESYKKATDGCQKELSELSRKREHLRQNIYVRNAGTELSKVNQDMDQVVRRYEEFKKEEESYKLAHQKVMYRLESENKGWITRGGPQATKFFITDMLAPRLLTSTSDALYCTYFIKAMIKMRTPNFQLLDFYNNWTTLLTQFMRCSTEKEAEIFGLFLREMMSYILQLRQDEKAFNEQMRGNPVFYRNYYTVGSKDTVVYCKYQELKKGHSKWEGRILKALRPGLESKDWMEKSTALKVLFKTTKVFPMLQKNVENILELVQNIADNETRKDIKTFASSYVSRLKLHKQHWYPDEDKKKEDKEKDTTEKRRDERKRRDREGRDDDRDRKASKDDREERHSKRHRGEDKKESKRESRRDDDKNREDRLPDDDKNREDRLPDDDKKSKDGKKSTHEERPTRDEERKKSSKEDKRNDEEKRSSRRAEEKKERRSETRHDSRTDGKKESSKNRDGDSEKKEDRTSERDREKKRLTALVTSAMDDKDDTRTKSRRKDDDEKASRSGRKDGEKKSSRRDEEEKKSSRRDDEEKKSARWEEDEKKNSRREEEEKKSSRREEEEKKNMSNSRREDEKKKLLSSKDTDAHKHRLSSREEPLAKRKKD